MLLQIPSLILLGIFICVVVVVAVVVVVTLAIVKNSNKIDGTLKSDEDIDKERL